MWYYYLWKFWFAITKWIPTEFRGGRGRGVIGGGQTPTDVKTIDTVEIATTDNATDFGDLVQTGNLMGSGAASATRGVFFGGFIKFSNSG